LHATDTLFCLILSGQQAGAFAPGEEFAMTPPQGIDLDQYRTQAKELENS